MPDMATRADIISPIGDLLSDDSLRAAAEEKELAEAMAKMEFYEQVARLVVRFRMDYSLSQEELAKRIGSTRQAISRLESGIHKPNLETLRRILHAGPESQMVIGYRKAEAPTEPELVSV